ncbi:glycosyl hydrolases family 31-domain-containing protein [Clohesyomyces aquaticus]|uniref:Glycosyl hydrolases family 31-domain-containing protein n=1 Tax=Clohesyomyces aquaticus TaxID=1231657 RepID=A0A1Y2AAN7_9PLEO|nr:glycosyl hydrolases family 31-domain-containing protein [Clohesyomyces aquaticus]
MSRFRTPLLSVALACVALGNVLPRQSSNASLAQCPGYAVSNTQDDGSRFTADLSLAGSACNVYGEDLTDLKLEVEYQTTTRLHVKIYDAAQQVYQVPESVFPKPSSSSVVSTGAALAFTYTESPFSFAVTRKDTNETLFDSSAASFVFENQYLRLRTHLPSSPNLYGLGEHTDPFRLNTTNYTRTMWNRDAYGTPIGTNLYGQHPIYFDHRGASGTHGVFLLSSSGMDIKINDTDGQYLEYNTLGGIIDLYFLAGPSPKDVSMQYAEIAGLPVMQPYWGFGFHQCKYGYRDVYQVAEVVANYSIAEIPLETMWTDIDYMELRKVFTLDPERFPLEKVRELVSYLHEHQQHYIVMVDPAVAYQDYPGFNNGMDLDVFLKRSNGSIYKGAVWPGVTAFPDWFHPDTQTYWDNEFLSFFDPDTGVDIDALWIDMNEASNFCPFPCDDPEGFAEESGNPPKPPPVRNNSRRAIPGFPADFQLPTSVKRSISLRQVNGSGTAVGLPGRDLLDPAYKIKNAAGSISNLTIRTDLINYGGTTQYDTHNLYGTMMSTASRDAMLARRPDRRPLIITRSTFAGAGARVGHWLGDNFSDWDHYRISIAEILEFAALFQIPMVGTDVCGFAQNTTEQLCARWAMLGAFSPFYRNHADYQSVDQEFYRWATVAEAARTAISVRYRLMDYIYSHLHRQSTNGAPMLNPLFFEYPEDSNTFGIQYQYFYGDSILVSPVTEENATDVSIYLPNEIFYDFWTHEKIQGTGSYIQLNDVPFTSIPLHIKGGSIIPLRETSANTTTELRKQNFLLWIAPNASNQAIGSLYLDEGNALEQPATSEIVFTYDNGAFKMTGSFGYNTTNVIAKITVLGGGKSTNASYLYNEQAGSMTINGPVPLNKEFNLSP